MRDQPRQPCRFCPRHNDIQVNKCSTVFACQHVSTPHHFADNPGVGDGLLDRQSGALQWSDVLRHLRVGREAGVGGPRSGRGPDHAPHAQDAQDVPSHGRPWKAAVVRNVQAAPSSPPTSFVHREGHANPTRSKLNQSVCWQRHESVRVQRPSAIRKRRTVLPTSVRSFHVPNKRRIGTS